jgi:predicted RNA binding protein YcfA (HicA-like mRNA interferase family)
MNKPALETNRAKLAARLGREGWIVKNGGSHDLYKHPDRHGQLITLPRHRTVTIGVARAIAKTADWLK